MKFLQTIKSKIAYIGAAALAAVLYQSTADDNAGVIKQDGFDWNSLTEIPRVYANVEDDSPPDPPASSGGGSGGGSGMSCSACSNGAASCTDADGTTTRIPPESIPAGMSAKDVAKGLESGELTITYP